MTRRPTAAAARQGGSTASRPTRSSIATVASSTSLRSHPDESINSAVVRSDGAYGWSGGFPWQMDAVAGGDDAARRFSGERIGDERIVVDALFRFKAALWACGVSRLVDVS